MAFSFRQVPSPSPSVVAADEVTTPSREAPKARTRMLNIQDLLNPSASDAPNIRRTPDTATPPPTPASTIASSYSTTSRLGTPVTTISAKSQKPLKGLGITTHNGVNGAVNYPPHELTEHDIHLAPEQQRELSRYHKRFQVLPCSENEQESIAEYTRHIPYSSDKKTFGGKTGRDGFNVFQYIFRVPGEPNKFTVMWDYDNGLVRITPFFKACNYSKTTPAKAIHANNGLKDLAHSITGGALDAQGYWMPYWCARALCTTFCYDIRWALTPIFGPRFIFDCIQKDDLRFARFKINPEIIRKAQLEADSWKTPPIGAVGEYKAIPRSVPDEPVVGSAKDLRPRTARPTFREGSPFSTESETTYALASSGAVSPEISPKTTFSSPAWTSINLPHAPATPVNTPFGSLQNSLLNNPRYASWRPAEIDHSTHRHGKTAITETSTQPEGKRNQSKRRRSSARLSKSHPNANYTTSRSKYDAEQTQSESDDAPIVAKHSVKKRARRAHNHMGATSSPTSAAMNETTEAPSRKYRAEDYRAAQWLLNLSMHDADLATGPNGPVDLNKKK